MLSPRAEKETVMESYKIAGVDVHKKMLAVVVTDAAREGEVCFVRNRFGTMGSDLRELREWLASQQVREVVMESTAQYWRPVWLELEPHFKLHLAQAQSNRAPKGRKRDFQDAERLARRHLAGELILSFVPEPEQRLWRTLTRTKNQLTRDRVRMQNQMESLLEEARIKLTSCVSDSLGLSSRRMLRALAAGATDAAELAQLAEPELQAPPEQLREALSAAPGMELTHRRILKLLLERVELIERQRGELEQILATTLKPYEDAVTRLAEVPGFGVNSAQQVIAEVGPAAATFSSPEELASWMGACPGREESAEVSTSNRCPKGNRPLRRVLTQVAHAAIKNQGNVFHAFYRRLVVRKGHPVALWAVVHRLCRLTWKILHQGVSYEERGRVANPKAVQQRKKRLVRALQALGFQVQLTSLQPATV